MTTNAFIFSWDCMGIESIIPITQYEHHDQNQLINILSEKSVKIHPLHNIIGNLVMRAKFNTQRYYEIYAIDCDISLDQEFWINQWKKHPQETANLIRDTGIKIHSDRRSPTEKIVIT